jgi:hypothetical protein
MTTRDYDDEFAAIAADDALLDGLAWGELTPPDDGLGQLLASWRQELDVVLDTLAIDVSTETLVTFPARRGGWLHRRTAGIAAAALVVVAGSTGAAAAAGGPHGPLGAVNRVLFGAPAPGDSALVLRVRNILDRVQQGVDDARDQGGATPTRLAALGDQLDVAGSLLASDQTAPPALGARLTALRADLAELETLPPNPPAVGDGGRSARSGGDSDSSSGSGHDDGDTRSGSDDGTSGSDSGTSGSDDSTSGSDDGTSGSDGGTSGSDGGTSGSDGGTSGSDGGSSDGGTSGSDGGTSGSDGGSSDGGSSDGGTSESDGGSDGGSSATS